MWSLNETLVRRNMLVGKAEFDYAYIKENIQNPQRVVDYVESLVPTWAKHINGITDNQKYYAALRVRNAISIPYKQRTAVVEALMRGTTVTGLIYQVVTIEQVLAACNTEAMCKLLEEVKKRDGR